MADNKWLQQGSSEQGSHWKGMERKRTLSTSVIIIFPMAGKHSCLPLQHELLVHFILCAKQNQCSSTSKSMEF